MKEGRQHFGVLCFIISRKVEGQPEHTKKLCAVGGEGAVSDRTCQKWSAKSRAPQSGRPGEVDSDPIGVLRPISVLPRGSSPTHSNIQVNQVIVSLILQEKPTRTLWSAQ